MCVARSRAPGYATRNNISGESREHVGRGGRGGKESEDRCDAGMVPGAAKYTRFSTRYPSSCTPVAGPGEGSDEERQD